MGKEKVDYYVEVVGEDGAFINGVLMQYLQGIGEDANARVMQITVPSMETSVNVIAVSRAEWQLLLGKLRDEGMMDPPVYRETTAGTFARHLYGVVAKRFLLRQKILKVRGGG